MSFYLHIIEQLSISKLPPLVRLVTYDLLIMLSHSNVPLSPSSMIVPGSSLEIMIGSCSRFVSVIKSARLADFPAQSIL